MTVIFLLISILLLLVGGLLTSHATVGVGIVCAAAVFGIYARILQADKHHQKVMAELREKP